MKPSAAQGTLLVCIFLVIQIKAAHYVSFTFYYNCEYERCISTTVWFNEYQLESFRDCLCSASTSACYVYYYKENNEGYNNVYYQRNHTYSLRLINNNYKYRAEFNCTFALDGEINSGNIQCYRSFDGSNNAFKSFQFTTETNECDFMCINIIQPNIYYISFDNNKIINDSAATCSLPLTTLTTAQTLTAQQPTTSEDQSTTTSTTTKAVHSIFANPTKVPDYNHSQTNTSGFGNTRNVQDNITDIGLITGVTTAIAAVIVIVLVTVFLWRRRTKKLNHEKSKDENTFRERHVTASDPSAMILYENNDQILLESSKEKNGQSAETKGINETTTSENYVEYTTVKKKSERQPNTVSTSLNLDIDTGHPKSEIKSLSSKDSTEVDLDPLYCNINDDTSHTSNASIKLNFGITSQKKSEDIYTNIHQSPENEDKTIILNAEHPITFGHPTNANNVVSDYKTSVAISPAQTTADVYARLGDQNKELSNLYNTFVE